MSPLFINFNFAKYSFIIPLEIIFDILILLVSFNLLSSLIELFILLSDFIVLIKS